MNSQEILTALAAARSFKTEPKQNEQIQQTYRNPSSFVSMYDELDKMDMNTFDNPMVHTK